MEKSTRGVKDMVKVKDTERLLQEIALDIVRNSHTRGDDPEIDERVSQAYQKLTGRRFRAFVIPSEGHVTPTALFGPPGHGKSSIFRAAAKMAAEAMGMRFIDGERLAGMDETEIGKDDFLFVVKEMAGQVSAITATGIPAKAETKDGEEYMRVIPERVYSLTRRAGSSLFLLDDFGNAQKNVIPAFLGLLRERSYGDIQLGRNTMLGLTSNLGEHIDGAIGITSLGKAIMTRVKRFYVEDDPQKFVTRFEQKMARNPMFSAVGDLGIPEFVMQHPEFFEPKLEGEACPRTLEEFIKDLPYVLHSFIDRMESILEGKGGMAGRDDYELLEGIRSLAVANMGDTAGTKAVAFYESFVTGVEPSAVQYFALKHSDNQSVENTQKAEKIKKNVLDAAGSGISQEEVYRMRQIASAGCDLASRQLVSVLTGSESMETKRNAVIAIARTLAGWHEGVSPVALAPVLSRMSRRLVRHLYKVKGLTSTRDLDLASLDKEKVLDPFIEGYKELLTKMNKDVQHDLLGALTRNDEMSDMIVNPEIGLP